MIRRIKEWFEEPADAGDVLLIVACGVAVNAVVWAIILTWGMQ